MPAGVALDHPHLPSQQLPWFGTYSVSVQSLVNPAHVDKIGVSLAGMLLNYVRYGRRNLRIGVLISQNVGQYNFPTLS